MEPYGIVWHCKWIFNWLLLF